MDSMAEAYLLAELVKEIASAIPQEVHTDWESGYVSGLKKAMRILEGAK